MKDQIKRIKRRIDYLTNKVSVAIISDDRSVVVNDMCDEIDFIQSLMKNVGRRQKKSEIEE
jgi:hypothetical protein